MFWFDVGSAWVCPQFIMKSKTMNELTGILIELKSDF